MKSKTVFFFFIILGLASHAQTLQTSGWQWQNPLPAGGAIQNIHFQNEKLGWANSLGSLLRTSNGGTTWNTTQLEMSVGTLKIFENGKGILIGGNSSYFTTNRGKNWLPAGSISGFNTIPQGFILTELIAWAYSQRKIKQTTNGGQTWQDITSNATPSSSVITKLLFINPNLGWLVATGGLIKKTTDGGATWNEQSSGITSTLLGISFIDENIGWVCGDEGRILKTSNGGTTWTAQSSGQTGVCRAIEFLNENIGVAAGAGYVVKTTNGGITWNPTTVLGTNFGNFASLHWVSPTICMAGAGFGQGIFRSTDAGQTWESPYEVNSSTFSSVKSGNSLVGAVGSGIIRSTNEGLSWLSSNTVLTLKGLSFAGNSLSTWIAVGNGGNIRRSTNRGVDWSAVSSGTNQDLNAVSFVDGGSQGYLVGNNGTVLSSANQGANWAAPTVVFPSTTRKLNSVTAAGLLVAYAVGADGTILKTTDGGNMWGSGNIGNTNELFSVHFLNANIGWVAGANNTLLRTTNGGSTWSSLSPLGSGASTSFIIVDFYSLTHGIALNTSGDFYHTTNSGSTWSSYRRPVGTSILSSYMDSENTIYATGLYGVVLKTTRAGAPCALWATIEGQDTISICGTETKTLSAVVNETGSYQWFKNDASIAGATNQALTVSTPGDYHVRVTSAGCTSITHATHVQQVSVPAAPSISATESTSFCSGQSITLNSGGGTPVIWFRDGNQLSSTPSSQWIANQAGNYTGRSISQGCSSAVSNVVAVSLAPAPSITVQPSNQNISLGVNALFQVQVLQSAATYQWQTDVTGTGFQNLNNVLQYSGVTTNSLRVANVNPANNNQPFRCIVQLSQCRDTSTVAVLNVATNIKPKSAHHLVLYPNPGYDELHINGLEISGEIECYDALGKLQFKASALPDVPLNLHHLSDGVYHIKLLTGKDLFSFKWLKINK